VRPERAREKKGSEAEPPPSPHCLALGLLPVSLAQREEKIIENWP